MPLQGAASRAHLTARSNSNPATSEFDFERRIDGTFRISEGVGEVVLGRRELDQVLPDFKPACFMLARRKQGSLPAKRPHFDPNYFASVFFIRRSRACGSLSAVLSPASDLTLNRSKSFSVRGSPSVLPGHSGPRRRRGHDRPHCLPRAFSVLPCLRPHLARQASAVLEIIAAWMHSDHRGYFIGVARLSCPERDRARAVVGDLRPFRGRALATARRTFDHLQPTGIAV